MCLAQTIVAHATSRGIQIDGIDIDVESGSVNDLWLYWSATEKVSNLYKEKYWLERSIASYKKTMIINSYYYPNVH
jgi:hypothetical protein